MPLILPRGEKKGAGFAFEPIAVVYAAVDLPEKRFAKATGKE
jgi:hypothetical protein